MPCLAYFLTWHTYGTWLHGDTRGSVDLDHNRFGTPFLPPDAVRLEKAKGRMKQEPFVLTRDMREVVDQAIRDHASHRSWRVLALNVRSNHVHLGLGNFGDYSPEQVMQQCKSWGTRRLIEAGHATSTTRVWTDHGSTRYISTPESLAKMMDYILNQQ